MKKLFTLLILPLLVLAGCSDDDDDIVSAQKTSIVSYLTATHSPKLIAEEDVDEDGQVPYYSTVSDGVYRYIDDIYDSSRPGRPEVMRSSEVTITFRAYVFTKANIVMTGDNVTMPFYSNDPLIEQAMYEAGLTPGVWPFEPLRINMADTGILKGLYSALLGCREGDYVEAYMTSEKGYGDIYVGTVTKDSPVVWIFTVNSVE